MRPAGGKDVIIFTPSCRRECGAAVAVRKRGDLFFCCRAMLAAFMQRSDQQSSPTRRGVQQTVFIHSATKRKKSETDAVIDERPNQGRNKETYVCMYNRDRPWCGLQQRLTKYDNTASAESKPQPPRPDNNKNPTQSKQALPCRSRYLLAVSYFLGGGRPLNKQDDIFYICTFV